VGARAGDEPAVLEVEGLSKSFGGTRALDRVDLEIRGGEIHALVGQNGSGKSTLIKILSGYHQADSGRISILARQARLPLDPEQLRSLGIGFVHQDLGLVSAGTVLENLRIGRFTTGIGRRIRWRRERETARRLLARFDLELGVDEPVSRCSQTERAILAVARALADVEASRGRGLLVMDEPTTALPAHEIDVLFDAMRKVAAGGSAALLVTHNIDEVISVADRVSTLRDGRLVASEQVTGLDHDRIAVGILGRRLEQAYPEIEPRDTTPLMDVRELSGRIARHVSFTLHAGEILGLTGLAGAGHDEVPYLIYGAVQPTTGEIAIGGRPSQVPTLEGSRGAEIALLPADRQSRSGTPRATVRENVTLPALASYRTRRGIDRARERSEVREALVRFEVKPPDGERPLYSLSGGNQQKALLARWLRLEPRVLLLHEPTQGVDIGARRGIFEILTESAARGTSVLYASVEYEDLANVCDRVLVFDRGRVVGELSGAGLTADRLAQYCYRGTEGAGMEAA